jgi:hypothetical protein
MGFTAMQWAMTRLPEGLVTAQICIVQRSAWSCQDATGFLPRSGWWLANKCALSLRSLERHLPQLADRDLLVKGDGGFRLPRFLAEVRQIGGSLSDTVSANLSANLAERKERTKEKKEQGMILRTEPPYPPQAGGFQKPTRADRKREALRDFGWQRVELEEFVAAWCPLCEEPHAWTVADSYFDSHIREMACPEALVRR